MLTYDSITGQITIRQSLSEMSGRDKHDLFRKLLEESGILEDLMKNQQAAEIIDKGMQNLWSAK